MVKRLLTTMLFMPGSEQGKLDKLPSIEADAVIIDLEDAVAVTSKGEARQNAADAISRFGSSSEIHVRVNSLATEWFVEDLEAIVNSGLAGIVVPKVESPHDLKLLDSILEHLERTRGLEPHSISLIATIESAQGVRNVEAIAGSSSRLRCLGFGAGDFSLDIGLEWPPPTGRLSATLVNAKTELVLASRLAGLEPPHDGVYPDFRNVEALRAECEQARDLGFYGKHAIHPVQIPVIRDVFAATDDQIRRARRIVEKFEASERAGVAAIHIDGLLIDYPVAERARRFLAVAETPAESPNPSEPTSAPLPLDGLRVLDLSNLYAGPLVATNLGDFGADVVKVEHPRGDDARRWGLSKDGIPLWWKVVSRNKRLISLDLNNAEDRERIRELAGHADVLVENFRPGRMESWGLGWDDLHAINPRLVMVRMSGFGQTGPYAPRPGFGTLAEAFSGFAAITGLTDGPPTLPPFGLADGVAALTATYATLTALYWRDARGGNEGQVVDVSLYEPLFSILGPQAIEYTQTGAVQRRQGNRSGRTAPRNAYVTADDRWVVISAGTQQIANRVFASIERPELADDPRFSSAARRNENADAVDELVASWIATHSLSDVLAAFEAAEAPIAPVYEIDQILEDPHYRQRDSIVTVPDEDLGEVVMQNIAPRLSRTPGRIRWAGRAKINADAASVYEDLHGNS
jgi:crotonobetainyl-CoA:carnitine CoA-transferase CaiB-like acyl-CoA transferase/citrate lyase beta subunit